MRNINVAFVVLMLFNGAVWANSAPETASAYFDALKKKDYNSVASYFDPSALQEFRQMMGFIDEIPNQGKDNFFTMFFGPEATKDSVSKLSDVAFVSSLLAALMTQVETRGGGVNFEGVEILGEVKEGPGISHVVTRSRLSVGEMQVEAMEVVSFRLVGKEWKALMSAKMKGIANQIRAAISRQK